MIVHARGRRSLMAMTALAACCVLAMPAVAQQAAQPTASARLADSVKPAVAGARLLGRLNPSQAMLVVVSLNFARPQEAQAYADSVSDPDSPIYRQFLTPEQIGDRFGPSPAQYGAVVAHLLANGLTVTEAPGSRMSITATGSAARMETAFAITLNRYVESDTDRVQRGGPNAAALTFYANANAVQIPSSLAGVVKAVAGLDDYDRARPKLRRSAFKKTTGPFSPVAVRLGYDSQPIFEDHPDMRGQHRAIAIVSLEQTDTDDTLDYINYFHLPVPSAGAESNVHFVNVAGGATDPPSGEANLDEQMVLGMAPLANIYIYNSTYTFAHYLDVVSLIVKENKVDLVTDSWGITPSNQSGYQQFHDQHTMMTMLGISYLNASGDYGSDLAANGLYPETDPDVLAVGGTVMNLNLEDQRTSEHGWHGSAGGWSSIPGFLLPTYQQSGRGIPTGKMYRMVPDVALHASAADDNGGYSFFLGGQRQTGYIGTSFASPVLAGNLLLVEQYMIELGELTQDSSGHYRLGRMNDALYAMNGRDDVFHDITIGMSDPSTHFPNGFSCHKFYDNVTGWGSLDFLNLAVALGAPLKVTVSPNAPTVHSGGSAQFTAAVQGSNVQSVVWSLVSGPGSIDAAGKYLAPASITGTETAVVQATSTIDTASPVSGQQTITLKP